MNENTRDDSQNQYSHSQYGQNHYGQRQYGPGSYGVNQHGVPREPSSPMGYGQAVAGAFGQQDKKGLPVGIIVGSAAVAAAIVVAVLFGTGVLGGGRESDTPQIPDGVTVPADTGDPSVEDGAYGDVPHYDELWASCADGDMNSCDELFYFSPPNSEYEMFGDTCGYRVPPSVDWCLHQDL